MDLATFERLLTPNGQWLLRRAVELLAAGEDELAATSHLRADNGHPELTAAATSQARLRARAAEKFGPDAACMYFTSDGLEQATHRLVADLRCQRAVANGAEGVLDLCCGVGGDLVAFARRTAGDVVGIERDPATAAVAKANLRALGLSGRAEPGDAADVGSRGRGVVFIDPARRGPAGRVFDPGAYSPSWRVVEDFIRRGSIAKMAPGIPHDLLPTGVEAEWVSLDGQLREATIWPEAFAVVARRATVVRRGAAVATLTSAKTESEATRAAPVGQFVYEPDDAVIRAHLVADFAATIGGWVLDPHLAYVSSDERCDTPLGATYRVLDILPFRERALRAALRARDVGPLQIKKRGVAVTPEQLRARLRLRGSTPATVILTRTPAGAQALLVEQLQR